MSDPMGVLGLGSIGLRHALFAYLTGRPLAGWTSVMLAVTLFFGLQFLMMGIVGEYLYRIYAEVVRRPLYFVSASPPQLKSVLVRKMVLDGVEMMVRANLGIFTQPISFIGLPVAAVPIHREGRMPIGIQVIAAPWREDICLRVSAALEQAGVARAPVVTP